MNVINYIKNHANDTFDDFAFTEIDSLIFALLPYVDFSKCLRYKEHKKKKIKEIASCLTKNDKLPLFLKNTNKMFLEMAKTKRYADILLTNYLKIVNKEMQFSALTIKIPHQLIYIAYAGTDTSIIGWEEDFKLAYLYPGISQKYAANYFNRAISIFDKNIYLGGHSKGGNLAICASMNSRFYLKNKIKYIYNFDGPGFLKEQFYSKPYLNIKYKIKMYVPKSSIIGMLLYHTDNYEIISAKNIGLLQHDAFNWNCTNTKFIRTKQDIRSKNLERKLTEKIEELSIPERINLINNVFVIFKDNNIVDTKDIKIKELFKIIKAFKSLDKETQNWLIEFLLLILIK